MLRFVSVSHQFAMQSNLQIMVPMGTGLNRTKGRPYNFFHGPQQTITHTRTRAIFLQ